MSKKKHYITFSGGKDSLATVIWAMINLEFDQWNVVFCDTGWESEETYKHILYVEEFIGKKFIRLKTTFFDERIDKDVLKSIYDIFGEHNVFAMMVVAKMRFPSTKARFCTEFLKMRIMIDFILGLDHDCVIVQGVRSEESEARRMLKAKDDYFKFYFEPKRKDKKGNDVYDNYRSEEVIAWCDKYTADVERPILDWKVESVFSYIKEHGFQVNPTYLKGASRVGCWPCIMCRLGEIKIIAQLDPNRIDQIAKLEELTGSTFFPAEFIPSRFCTKVVPYRVYPEDLFRLLGKKVKQKNGNMFGAVDAVDPNDVLYERYFKNAASNVQIDEDGDEYIMMKIKVPTIKDVVRYVSKSSQTDIADFISHKSCVSPYNICE